MVETQVSTIRPSIVCLEEYLLQKVKFLETFEIIGEKSHLHEKMGAGTYADLALQPL